MNRGEPSKNSKFKRNFNKSYKKPKKSKSLIENRNDSTYQENLLLSSSQKTIIDKYKHWKLYMKDVSNQSIQDVNEIASKLLDFYSSLFVEDKFPHVINTYEGHVVYVDVKQIKHWDNEWWNDVLNRNLISMPFHVLSVIALAFHQCYEDINQELLLGTVQIRLLNCANIHQIYDLRATHYGKFVTIKANVIKVHSVRSLVVEMDFCCKQCFTMQRKKFTQMIITLPTSCSSEECHSNQFELIENSIKAIDWQIIKIQDYLNEIDNDEDTDDIDQPDRDHVTENPDQKPIPKSIECHLYGDLVDTCIPGDVVVISGIVQVDDGNQLKADKLAHTLSIHVNSIKNFTLNRQQLSIITPPIETVRKNKKIEKLLTAQEFAEIDSLIHCPNIYKRVINSMCPSIYGHENVKAGILLALVGGSKKPYKKNCKTALNVRPSPHILIVGDPGLGKSQMILAAMNVATKSVYVCGNTSSSTGLTAYMTKEAGSNDFSLEAGATVIADQGVCFIDEFDKMSNQHASLLEVMEQQSVSIAKCGVLCNLKARTSIIAAANPKNGHYNRNKPILDNIRINAALLSRFDMIFVLLDKPSEKMDSKISDHILNLHSKRKKESNYSMNDQSSNIELDQIIPPKILRNYLIYCKNTCYPKLDESAAEILQEHYIECRQNSNSNDYLPITSRYLESLIRLTQARAKIELRQIVTSADATDIVNLMIESKRDLTLAKDSGINFSQKPNAKLSKTKQIQLYLNEIEKCSQCNNSKMFSYNQLEEIYMNLKLTIDNFNDLLLKLNQQGLLLKKGPKLYQITSNNY